MEVIGAFVNSVLALLQLFLLSRFEGPDTVRGPGGSVNLDAGGRPFVLGLEYKLQNYQVSKCLTGNVWTDYNVTSTLLTTCTCKMGCQNLIHYSKDAITWKVVVPEGGYQEGSFKLVNKQTGKCLTLGLDSGSLISRGHNNWTFYQLPCRDYSTAQAFKLGQRYLSNAGKSAWSVESLLINGETEFGDWAPLVMKGSVREDNAAVTSATFASQSPYQFWYFVPA